ncbi:unnamed protein product [Brachionus calyciflorus]|uniref:AMOP domain-containing protein n=1 Tax=Brachionus calyciflorus TaxID=104777 RepID=A0A813NYF3_9BILA|nr:unnamed protein product [Brachionus calyciflorus]
MLSKKIAFLIIFFVEQVLSYDVCKTWHQNQVDPIPFIQSLPPCRPKLPLVENQAPYSFEGFIMDNTCNPSSPIGCQVFHPGSHVCYRSVYTVTIGFRTAGQQCCYNRKYSLLVGPPSGGTLDLADSKNKLKHFLVDVTPYFLCCLFSNNCDLYYEKRPSDDGLRWRPPMTAGVSGLSHFVTLNGISYTFKTQGIFKLFEIKESNFIVHIKLGYLEVNNKTQANMSVLKALSIKSQNDHIQIETNQNNNLIVNLNKNNSKVSNDKMDLKDAHFRIENGKKIEITYGLGIHFTLELSSNLISLFTSINSNFRSKINGLLTFNTLNFSSENEIRNFFNKNRITNFNETLFDNSNVNETGNYNDFSYIENIEKNQIEFNDFELESLAKKRCNENEKCLYDVSLTGSLEIGESNLKIDKYLEFYNENLN